MATRNHIWDQGLLVILLLTNTVLAGVAAPPIKEQPERGKMLATGDACLKNSRPADGLLWYRQAALAGSMDAVYRAGNLMLDGQKSDLPAQSVVCDLSEGVRWMFWAATNMHPQACRGMSRVYGKGTGVKTNLVQAYAWMRLYSELDPSEGLKELDKLAVNLDVQQIQEAQRLAREFKNRQWPPLPCKRIVEGDARLNLNGLTSGGRNALAVINRKTLAEGETAEFVIPKGHLTVTCLEIRDQSVLVDIAGESEARLLSFR